MQVLASTPMTPTFVRVLETRRECHDVVSLTLASPHETTPRPGQFNMLYGWGAGESAISMSDIRADRVTHTVRGVGNVTEVLCRLQVGQSVGLRGPFGNAWPLEACRDRDVVIVAGGIGLAPLRPVIETLYEHPGSHGRTALLYGARRPADLIYEDDRRRWAGRLSVSVTVDAAEPSWTGATGVVTKFLPDLAFDPATAVALLCGPEVMMRAAARELGRLGLAFDRIFVSLERSMKCAIGVCGHCQLGTELICRDGPVYSYDRVRPMLHVRAL